MKKNLILIFIFFIGATSFVNLKQEGEYQSNDYRDSFTGRYTCARTSTSYNFGGTNTKKDMAIIIVTKHASDSMLQVKLPGGVFLFKLQNNRLHSAGTHNGSGRFFSNDSLFLNMPMGHSSVISYAGNKSN